MNIPEWGFPETPDQVDLDRIWNELTSMPCIYAFSYLEQFKKNAPKTYDRFCKWRTSKKCTVFNYGDS